jgi:protein-L-isoaspartate O-methyltransferase
VTPYDLNAYPTAIFAQTTPDRMATAARLTGLAPPPIETARVLEIGGGDGMNLLAMAIAYPRASFTSFDLAATAIARGRRWLEGVGAPNLRLVALDILDAADTLAGPFDYIIAHGVYAWVPPQVRAATMALIGRLLVPDGVAFVSYNALPGGYIRLGLRDAMTFATKGLEGAEKVAAVREHLTALAESREGSENPAQAAFRDAARQTREKPWAVLGHDEMGPCFFPQAIGDVAAAAAAHGLQYLGEADRERMSDAFLPDDAAPEPDTTAQLVRLLQGADYRDVCFFRHSLLVRDEVRPSRRLDLDALAGLYATSRCRRRGDREFQLDDRVFEVSDAPLSAALGRLVDGAMARVRVGELVDTPLRLTALFEMFEVGLVELHSTPAPYATRVPERPVASPLIRLMLAEGHPRVCTLDQRMMVIEEEGPRHLLAHLDGTRDRAALATIAREAGLDDADALETALAKLAREAALVA